jgi:hypothetical protein
MNGSTARTDSLVVERVLRLSDLEWTIVYTSPLTEGPASGSVAVLPKESKRRMSRKISRANVAAWMVCAASSVQLSRHKRRITG